MKKILIAMLTFVFMCMPAYACSDPALHPQPTPECNGAYIPETIEAVTADSQCPEAHFKTNSECQCTKNTTHCTEHCDDTHYTIKYDLLLSFVAGIVVMGVILFRFN